MAESISQPTKQFEEDKTMSLLDDFKEHCVFVNQAKVDDEYGGYKKIWTDGASFDAVIARSTSMETRTAEKAGVTSLYTITVSKSIQLEFHDVIKRPAYTDADGNAVEEKIFRVTSDGDDYHTPRSASLDMRQVTAEEFVLPTN